MLPEPTAARLRREAGRLERWFDDCDDWMKPPADGAYLVVCDEDALDDFFDDGLETIPADAPRIADGRVTGAGRAARS